MDAIKIDLKSFSQDFYTSYVRGELQPVLEAIKIVHKKQIWLEIVYLVIPTLNDSPKEIRSLAQWIMKEIGPDVPIHFNRFNPMYLVKNLPQQPWFPWVTPFGKWRISFRLKHSHRYWRIRPEDPYKQYILHLWQDNHKM